MTEASATQRVGLILAGGAGRRVGGQDKGLLRWQGQPLVSYPATAIRPLVDELWISCNRNQSQYQPYADRLLQDEEPAETYAGPLAGICAALPQLADSVQVLLLSPCDTPGMSPAHWQRFVQQAQANPQRWHYLHSEAGSHYLHAWIPRAYWPLLLDFYRSGERAMHRLLAQLPEPALTVEMDEQALLNLNQMPTEA